MDIRIEIIKSAHCFTTAVPNLFAHWARWAMPGSPTGWIWLSIQCKRQVQWGPNPAMGLGGRKGCGKALTQTHNLVMQALGIWQWGRNNHINCHGPPPPAKFSHPWGAPEPDVMALQARFGLQIVFEHPCSRLFAF